MNEYIYMIIYKFGGLNISLIKLMQYSIRYTNILRHKGSVKTPK